MNATDVARERVNQLLVLAEKMYSKDVELSKKYVVRARKIAQKHRFSISSKKFCKNCGIPRVIGRNTRIRFKSQTILYTCLSCNKVKKYSYSSLK